MVIAHLGHWYSELLYVGPVLVVVAWLAAGNLREKRRLRRTGGEAPPPARDVLG